MSIQEVENIDDLGEGLIIVDFWAEWCGPCKALSSILEDIDREHDVTILKFDIEKDTKKTMDMDVRSVPTVVFYKDGQEVDRIIGLVAKEYIVGKIEELS